MDRRGGNADETPDEAMMGLGSVGTAAERQAEREAMRRARGLSKRQKTALSALTFAAFCVFYASGFFGWWPIVLLMFPIAYAMVLVRTW